MITLLYSGYYDLDKSKGPFEVDSNFYYTTRCDIPNILLVKKNNKHYVYYENPNIIFHDNEQFIDKLYKCFNAEVINLNTLMKLLNNEMIQTLPNIETHPEWTKLRKFPMDMSTISSVLSRKREIKLKNELSCIETSCKITSEGIKHILKNSYVGMSQIELSGLFKHYLSIKGIEELSFNPITSHNKYNQYLHYRATKKNVQKSSLILLDVGCKYKHYCSDISRCFPISGKFTQKQKNLYNVVLRGLKYALKLMKPGAHWSEITHKVVLKLYDECLKIKLVEPLENTPDKIKIMKTLMPHLLGHHVGLDNHDGEPITTLRKNMVIAVEPGIYFQTGKDKSPHINASIWKEYEHLGGVRIEDTILITSTGHKNLSKVTKEIKGIEGLMK